MKIIIDKPRETDVRDIQNVFFQTWLATYPNKEIGITENDILEKFKNRNSKEAIQKRIDEILNVSENKLFLVAKDEDMVIGVCKAEKEEEYNRLSAIYVLPEYQGKGIGKMFWEKCLEFFDKKKDIVVRVAEYNVNAVEFYKKLGFIATGKRFFEEKYRMPISGVIIPEIEMVLKLKK